MRKDQECEICNDSLVFDNGTDYCWNCYKKESDDA